MKMRKESDAKAEFIARRNIFFFSSPACMGPTQSGDCGPEAEITPLSHRFARLFPSPFPWVSTNFPASNISSNQSTSLNSLPSLPAPAPCIFGKETSIRFLLLTHSRWVRKRPVAAASNLPRHMSTYRGTSDDSRC